MKTGIWSPASRCSDRGSFALTLSQPHQGSGRVMRKHGSTARLERPCPSTSRRSTIFNRYPSDAESPDTRPRNRADACDRSVSRSDSPGASDSRRRRKSTPSRGAVRSRHRRPFLGQSRYRHPIRCVPSAYLLRAPGVGNPNSATRALVRCGR